MPLAVPGGRQGPPDAAAKPAAKPLLLVDIDGVISLFAADHEMLAEGSLHSIDGIPHFLSSCAGEHLLALQASFELAWCSGWEEKANEYLPYLLGLPGPLPYLSFDRTVRTSRANAHWKLDAIDAYAGAARPLAWVDDSFNDACHDWARVRSAPTLLIATAPQRGLTQLEVRLLEGWARQQAMSR